MSNNFYPVITDSDSPYDVNTFLEHLPGYDTSHGVTSMLDLARVINESGNYMWVGVTIPSIPQGQLTNVTANQTINGSITVPPGTFVVSLTHYCTYTGEGNNQITSFKFRLSDKGTKSSIFYGDYSLADLVSSPMQSTPTGILAPDTPFGPGWLMNPFIITPPGSLQWEIVNLADQSVLIQIMAGCAVPINEVSLNTRNIIKGQG